MKWVSVSISCHAGWVLLGTIKKVKTKKGYLHLENEKSKN